MTKKQTFGLVVYAFGTPHSNRANKALVGGVQQLIKQNPETGFHIYTQNDIQFKDSACLNVTYFPQLNDEGPPPPFVSLVEPLNGLDIKWMK